MAEPGEDGSYQVHRNIVRVLVRGGAALLGGAVVILSVGTVTVLGLAPGDTARHVGDMAVGAGFGAIWIWLGIRIIGSRIIAAPDGLFIHRVVRRCQFVPWEQVAGLELIRAPRLDNQFTRSSIAVAVLRAGHRPAYCLGASFDEPSPAADTFLKSLQADYQRWLTAHGFSSRA